MLSNAMTHILTAVLGLLRTAGEEPPGEQIGPAVVSWSLTSSTLLNFPRELISNLPFFSHLSCLSLPKRKQEPSEGNPGNDLPQKLQMSLKGAFSCQGLQNPTQLAESGR